MELIDVLEERDERVSLIENFVDVDVLFDEAGWWIRVDGVDYLANPNAMNQLMNILRIPTKYIWRCVEDNGNEMVNPGGEKLAQDSINFWLKNNRDISFLVELGSIGDEITQVFPDKRLYLPGVRVNDFIIDMFDGDVEVLTHQVSGDQFYAVYLGPHSEEGFRLGVQIVYSDCFNITPRFDAVAWAPNIGYWAWPTVGRKFRVAANTIPQVFDQIYEFLDIATHGIKSELIPELVKIDNEVLLVDPDQFVSQLCSELRIPNKIGQEILCNSDTVGSGNVFWYTVHEYLSNLPETSDIDLVMRRDIVIGSSRWLVTGRFK